MEPAHLLPVLHCPEVFALAHVQEGDHVAVAHCSQHMGIRSVPAQKDVDAGGGKSQRALVRSDVVQPVQTVGRSCHTIVVSAGG